MNERVAAMLALRLQGASYRDIGKRFGVSRQRAQQLLSPPPAIRLIVIERAGGLCEGCGVMVGQSGHIHHGHPEHQDGDWFNSPERLQLLCPSCHSRAHSWVNVVRTKGDFATHALPEYVPDERREPFDDAP